MENIVILVIAAIVAFVFFKKDFGKQKYPKKYLQPLAKFLGQESVPEGEEFSTKIEFLYQGWRFVYEHIEEDYFSSKSLHRAVLKAQSPLNLTMIFFERPREVLGSGADSILDVARVSGGGIFLPKGLSEFKLNASDNEKALGILSDAEIIKLYQKFKNRDSKGQIGMSLEIIDGTVILHFHPPASGLTPSLLDVQLNVTTVADYAKMLLPLLEKMKQIRNQE